MVIIIRGGHFHLLLFTLPRKVNFFSEIYFSSDDYLDRQLLGLYFQKKNKNV